ncbi:geranylgeranylglycerol-phosphate geranylgeranyltransferase [Christiangramia sediminis]|uniref:Geranylgeranylglycerol-phosphate geranylgeranyltransferase n=1 Tax=Christiangramia sediminis TaxID=2881336 RepID=A0A9X1LHG2_9FLAO|nr:geranylgeranylglycerol-phosphate geranylgeranyltransferase [Christiangramia sediminis]MCB7480422.1 geranylgeranylglycerol-phosphate geranylgeranyltransferase [Christiangramia sediminis]
MLHFLKLIRVGNLIFIALTMFLIKYGLFEPFEVAITLNLFGFSMLVLAVVCVAASGYVINDIFDVSADLKNKPKRTIIGNQISEKTAYRLFFILNIIGVGLGFYLSNMIGRPGFVAFFIFGSAILYIYNSQFQQSILIGNILVSIIVGLIPVGVGLYDLLPAITPQNQQTQSVIFSILIDYSIFAFLINLLREIVKDQEDIDGDYNAGYKTLPIVLGKKRTNRILFVAALLPLGFLIYYIYQYLFENVSAVVYALFLLVAPLLFFLVNIWTAQKKSEFTRLSLILKFVLFFGLISIGLLQFILL